LTTITAEIKKNLISAKEKARLEYYNKLADKLVEEFKPVTIRETGEIRCSLGGDLTANGETFLQSRLREIMQERLTPAAQNVILNHVRASTYCSLRDLNSPDYVIPLANGDLDGRTGVLYNHKETEWQFLQRFDSIEYDPNARCPKILEALKRAQPRTDIRYRILRSWALCFDRQPIKRQAELWIGENNTGKSTLLNILKLLLGKQNYASQPLEALCSSDTEAQRSRAQLFGKAANIFADLQQIELKEVGMFKAIMGGDTVPCRFMYQSPVEYAPHTKMFFACNTPPIIALENIWADDAFFQRFRVTFFEQQIRAAEIMEDYYLEIVTKEEISGLFNILLGILRSVWAYHRYGYTFNAKETKELWQQTLSQMDKISKFINRYCTVVPPGDLNYKTATIPKSEFANRLAFFLKQEGYDPVGPSDINERLSKIAKEDRNFKTRAWRGIKWKEGPGNQTELGAFAKDGKDVGLTILSSITIDAYYKRDHGKPVFSVFDNGQSDIVRIWFSKFPGRPYFSNHNSEPRNIPIISQNKRRIAAEEGQNPSRIAKQSTLEETTSSETEPDPPVSPSPSPSSMTNSPNQDGRPEADSPTLPPGYPILPGGHWSYAGSKIGWFFSCDKCGVGLTNNPSKAQNGLKKHTEISHVDNGGGTN
jgi:P4 family phage/plasmid primase-like protien